MTFEVAVLLSVGRHPASGRARRAELDSRALELALRLAAASAGDGAPVRVHAVHAGSPAEPALRDYLGMGVERLTVLDIPASADPLAPLIAHLAARRPSLVLAGMRAGSTLVVAQRGDAGSSQRFREQSSAAICSREKR